MKSTFQSMQRELRPLLGVSLALLVITTVFYPLAVTGIAQSVFPAAANGSLVEVDGLTVGSSLIGQPFSAPGYFHGRPSAAGAGYDASASSGSNLGPTSAKLIDGTEDDPETATVDESFPGITQLVATYRAENGLGGDEQVPSDAVTSSASGLDPHISPANARKQARRVAAARGLDDGPVLALIDEFTQKPLAGFLGEPRVNVLRLNLALDERYPEMK